MNFYARLFRLYRQAQRRPVFAACPRSASKLIFHANLGRISVSPLGRFLDKPLEDRGLEDRGLEEGETKRDFGIYFLF